MDDVETLASLWVDLARDQRVYRSHLLATENRPAIAEAIGRSVVSDGVRIAVRADEGVDEGETGTEGGSEPGLGTDEGVVSGDRDTPADDAAGSPELPHPPSEDPATAAGVLGFVMFGLETGGYEQDVTRGVVHNLYVRPAHRDAGVGSALLETAEAALADRGADVVSLEAMMANQAAVRFYERNGYRQHRVELEKSLDDGSDGDTRPPRGG
jgi:ribosomal protein S18 acetylase RimI-like enzyme